MEQPQRGTHNDTPPESPPVHNVTTHNSGGGGGFDDQLEDLDIESILRRSRNLGRTRRRKPLCERKLQIVCERHKNVVRKNKL